MNSAPLRARKSLAITQKRAWCDLFPFPRAGCRAEFMTDFAGKIMQKVNNGSQRYFWNAADCSPPKVSTTSA
jgi:hypothetical protein